MNEYKLSPEMLKAIEESMGTNEQAAADAAQYEEFPDEVEENSANPYPARMRENAFHGLAGEIVREVLPHTEADSAALLASLIVGFGNLIDRTAYFDVSGSRHYCNLFAALAGVTGKGRKGTSWSYLEQIFRRVDREWTDLKVVSGLSTGEGLIWSLRDEITKSVTDKQGNTRRVIEAEAVTDKRLLAQEGEFSQVMQTLKREGNTLSATLRSAWDGKNVLQSITKAAKGTATGAHVSLLAHVTKEELLHQFSDVELLNGLGNRILWLCVRRSKLLPDGGNMPDAALDALAKKVVDAVSFARTVGRMQRDEESAAVWRKLYGELSAAKQGLAGVACARAEAQVLRLSCVYALLDRSDVVRLPHLLAALAFWEYCEESARFIFGGSEGDPVSDAILKYLRAGRKTQTEIYVDLFKKHRPAKVIKAALEKLSAAGKVASVQERGEGRAKLFWTVA